MARRKRKTRSNPRVKYGKIGAPHSLKRRQWMAKMRSKRR